VKGVRLAGPLPPELQKYTVTSLLRSSRAKTNLQSTPSLRI